MNGMSCCCKGRKAGTIMALAQIVCLFQSNMAVRRSWLPAHVFSAGSTAVVPEAPVDAAGAVCYKGVVCVYI